MAFKIDNKSKSNLEQNTIKLVLFNSTAFPFWVFAKINKKYIMHA